MKVPFACVATVSLLTACAIPSLQGIAEGGGEVVYDESFLGTWYAEDDVEFTVERGEGREYAITFTPLDEEDDAVEFSMTGALVMLDEHRVLDVRLSKDEMDAIAKSYGTLLVPAHQFYRFEGDAQRLVLSMLDHDWLERARIGVAVDGIPVMVSGPRENRGLIREALADEDAWDDAFELTRTLPLDEDR